MRAGGLTAGLSLADVPKSIVGAELARDGGLTAGLALEGVHIHFCGNGCVWFRPYGNSLWQTPQRKQMYGQPIFCHPATMNGKSSLR
jgi:hypothetical protein